MNAPQHIAESARARIIDHTAERLAALKHINAGRPLDAEPDDARKTRRLQTVMQVSAREAKAIADYQPEALAAAAKPAGREIVQGATADFLEVAFLELALAAAGTVARVAYLNGRPQGSGFMVSERLFLTNNHVVSTPAEARRFMLEFDYQRDWTGQPRASTRFALAAETFFLTSPETEFDFTLIAVGRRLDGRNELTRYGYCPLLARDDKHVIGELVNVVQHPEGNYKQTVIRENQLVTRLQTVLHYVADTMPGSSGSPVFNDQWEVIALHHWGGPFTETVGPDGQPVRYDVNEGIRISAIVRQLTRLRAQLGTSAARRLLDAVLEPATTLPGPAMRRDGAYPEASDVHALPGPELGADGRATWTVPLQISVNLGALGGAGARPAALSNGDGQEEPLSAATAIVAEAEKIRVDPNFSNRTGYNPRFLKGFTLPLPQLSAAHREVAARLLKPKAGQNPHELKYTHFSVVLNGERRMAFFTACNIDGTSWIDIDRDSGRPREGAEAAEEWFIDPRIAREVQSDQSLYDQQRPKRLFDRGHLVRRQDPTWGTAARAIRANADTFHFSNCTPQASTFNQRAQFWQGIEQYLLEDNAVADQDKISVFTGPVFAATDRKYRYTRVPAKFWKIIARVENGELLALALLADQSQFLQTLPESLEGAEDWDDTSKIDEYISSVREIERLTGLDFGVLRDHDVRGSSGSETGAEEMRRPLTSFEEIPLHPQPVVTKKRRIAAPPPKPQQFIIRTARGAAKTAGSSSK